MQALSCCLQLSRDIFNACLRGYYEVVDWSKLGPIFGGEEKRHTNSILALDCNKTNLLPTDRVIEHQSLRKTDQFLQLEYQEQFRNQQPDPLLAFHPLSQFFPVALITIEYPEKRRKEEKQRCVNGEMLEDEGMGQIKGKKDKTRQIH